MYKHKIPILKPTNLLTVLRRLPWYNSVFVQLCGVYFDAFRVESCLALCSRVFSILFSSVITSLGEERAGPYVVRACLSCMC